ncbi:MAG: hypothetical protein WC718_19490, partial [Phycisphaerales bacterium]
MTRTQQHIGLRLAGLMAFGIAMAAGQAQGQLRADEVLVIYDSRSADSKAVAEYYAGSAAVPGGVGNIHGARAGVQTFDLATSGQPLAPPGDISYPNFDNLIRNPIRTYLLNTNQVQTIRCLVTTKGMPHRVQDSTNPGAGDDPNALIAEYSNSDANMASVDTELTLLWISLDQGEAGGSADSRSDGVIQNPYWQLSTPIRTTINTNNRTGKVFSVSGVGPTWVPAGSIGSASRLSAGDLYLVSRLDGPTVADVRGIINRGANIHYNTGTMVTLLDESASNGIADAGANNELDNSASGFPLLRDADDYEITRDELLADRRFAATFTMYNSATGASQFFVGPRLSWSSGILVPQPVVLLATYGSNHAGRPTTTTGMAADTIYGTSFNYPSGAIF